MCGVNSTCRDFRTARSLVVLIGIAVALAMAGADRAGAAGPLPGIVAAYSFDQTSGSVLADMSGNGHDGTISGATWTSSGRYGGALSFDGTNASVDLGQLGTFYKTGFTYEAWIDKTTATKNDVAVVGTWNGSQNGGPMLWIDHLVSHYQLTLNNGISNYVDSG